MVHISIKHENREYIASCIIIQKDFHLFPLLLLSRVPCQEVAPVEETEHEEWCGETDAREHVDLLCGEFIILDPECESVGGIAWWDYRGEWNVLSSIHSPQKGILEKCKLIIHHASTELRVYFVGNIKWAKR